MDLFKWMGVNTSAHTTSNAPNGVKPGGVKPINHADYKQFGLENFGNTCYANAILQALYFCQPFRELVCDSHDKSNPPIPPSLLTPPASTGTGSPPSRPAAIKGFRRRDSTTDGGKSADEALPNGNASIPPGRPSSSSAPGTIPIPATPPTLFSALRSLFLHIALNPSDKGTVSPLTFINKLKKENELYRSSMHQDAHEFLNFLLNKIVEDLEAEMKKNMEMVEDLSNSLSSLPPATSSSSSTASPSQSSSDSQGNRHPHMTFVHSLFEGTLTSETRCLTCETVSSRDESFLDLSIDIEQNSSVTSCLRQFSASEMLSHKNKFFCDSCGGLQEAEKRMKIKKLPNVLALHLKRFKYQEDVQKYIKLAYRVAFPFELRLFNTVDDADDPDRLYQLFAIVVHIGGGPHHGHYIAIVRAHGTWLVFDDDNVEPIREADIPKYFGESPGGAGYVLFYQAVDLDLASVGIDPTPASTSDVGDASQDAEAESSGDSEPIAPVTPASIPQPMPSSAPVLAPPKLDIQVVEPDTSLPTPTGTSAPIPPNSGAKLFSGTLGRTLKHSQSVKISSDKKRISNQMPLDVDLPSPRAQSNGDAAPIPPVPLSPLTRSRSFKGKDKDGAGGWFGGLRKEKKEKRPPVPVPPLPVDGPGSIINGSARERPASELARPPSSPQPDHEREPSLLGQHSLLSTEPDPSASSVPPSPIPSPAVTPPPSAFPTDVLRAQAKSAARPTSSPSSLPSAVVPPPVPPLPTSPRTRRISQPHRQEVLAAPPPQALRPSTAGAKPKRASRKMSLTSIPAGLGMFGRKDKDKDRDKDRDRESVGPPSARNGRGATVSRVAAEAAAMHSEPPNDTSQTGYAI